MDLPGGRSDVSTSSLYLQSNQNYPQHAQLYQQEQMGREVCPGPESGSSSTSDGYSTDTYVQDRSIGADSGYEQQKANNAYLQPQGVGTSRSYLAAPSEQLGPRTYPAHHRTYLPVDPNNSQGPRNYLSSDANGQRPYVPAADPNRGFVSDPSRPYLVSQDSGYLEPGYRNSQQYLQGDQYQNEVYQHLPQQHQGLGPSYVQNELPRCDSSRSASSMSSASGPDDPMQVRMDMMYGGGVVGSDMCYLGPNDHGMSALEEAPPPPQLSQNLRPPPQHHNLHLEPTSVQPVPVGWRRLVVDNTVIYLSPSNVALSTMDQVKLYLQSAGTCKCGLQCPLHCNQVFNFDPKVASRPWSTADSDMCKLCNHKRKPTDPEPRHVLETGPAAVAAAAAAVPNPAPPVAMPMPPHLVAPVLAPVPAPPPPPKLTPAPAAIHAAHAEFMPKLKKKKKKQSTYSGVSVSQLLAQRERERAQAQAAAVAPGGGVMHRWAAPPRPQEAIILQQQQQQQPGVFTVGHRPRSIPPWHQTRVAVRKMNNYNERVPPLDQHMPPPVLPAPVQDDVTVRSKHRPYKAKRKHEPSFMDDPNGYLAQQTALLHNSIARPNMVHEVPLMSNMVGGGKRQHQHQCNSSCSCAVNSASPNASPVTSPDLRPIQGGTVSTSNNSPNPHSPVTSGSGLCSLPSQSPGNSGANAASSSSYDTAHGRTTEANAVRPPKHHRASTRRDVVLTNMHPSGGSGHGILLSSNGQYLGGVKLPQAPGMGTVLLNAASLPGPIMLQQGMMTVDTGHMTMAGNVVGMVDSPPLVSPDKKKKSKKRKTTPLTSPILQMGGGSNMVQLNQSLGGMQAVTLLPGGKGVVMNNPINLLQPVQFPFQQIILPQLGSCVMADGSTALLQSQDHPMHQLQLQPVLTNQGFITTPTGVLIRSPNGMVSHGVSPQESFIQILPQTSPVLQHHPSVIQEKALTLPLPLELEIVASPAPAQCSSNLTSASNVSTQTARGSHTHTNHTFCQTVSSPPDTTTRSPMGPMADTTTDVSDDHHTVTSSVQDSPNRHDGRWQGDNMTGLSNDSPATSISPPHAELNRPKKGELVWGPVGGFPAWPGKVISRVTSSTHPDDEKVVTVRWFGRQPSQRVSRMRVAQLKSLSEGLEAHHQASNAKRTKKLQTELETAIQEAMVELDKSSQKKRN